MISTRPWHHEKGFSMVELIVGITVLVIGLIPLMMVLRDVRQGVTIKEAQVNATMIAQNYLNLLQTKKWDEGSPDVGVYSPTKSDPLGSDSESSVGAYDDIDDFNGEEINVNSNCNVKFEVSYVDLVKNGAMTTSVIPTEFKSVEITAQMTGPHPVSAKITTVFTNQTTNGFN